MANNTRFVGLDVHAETISVAVAEGRNHVARSPAQRFAPPRSKHADRGSSRHRSNGTLATFHSSFEHRHEPP